ncbi:uncharacterized protein LOC114533682 [Dendronephthya gigantea]|uniref:uncharacterized protein LOC114533682 n=1 Tax=Dendronephthya gigantea TaxID=151771 RepID=UPI00106A4E4E|nr:uncharacterized protein LOC114533682 [Dendronephthya gigantea]
MAGLDEGRKKEAWKEQLGYEDSRFELANSISPSFHCPICMNVLNDPVMCRNNQHYFCKVCITKHLMNTLNCPTCQDELTADTLVHAPRIVIEYLSELRIRCDFFSRGCRHVMKLSDLNHHINICGFAAVKCSNERCEVIMNRQDKLHHEAEVCEFRRLQCHDCSQLKQEVQEIKEGNTTLQRQADDLSLKIDKIMMMVSQIMTEVEQPKEIKTDEQLSKRRSIVIVGGYKNRKVINSVEIFSWTQKRWTLLNPMLTCRSQASADIYRGEVIIAGGTTVNNKPTNTIESSLCDQPGKWNISLVKLPELLSSHASVVYEDSLILSGGSMGINQYSNKVYEISLVPPYSTKILTTMPKPRYDHTMELFEEKLFIFGGCAPTSQNTVMMYDFLTKEWKMMTPLPYAVDEMATVLWQNNVIVLDGRSSKDTVVTYNLTTGESKYLPSMKHK